MSDEPKSYRNCPQCDDKWTFIEMGVVIYPVSEFGHYTRRSCHTCKIKWDEKTGKIETRQIVSL